MSDGIANTMWYLCPSTGKKDYMENSEGEWEICFYICAGNVISLYWKGV
jgi:hypothetical protein